MRIKSNVESHEGNSNIYKLFSCFCKNKSLFYRPRPLLVADKEDSDIYR